MREWTLQETAAYLRTLEDVHILIHRSPDGDCVGGGYALHLMLKAMGIRSCVRCADALPETLAHLTEGIAFAEFPAKTVIAVDVSDLKLLGDLQTEYAEHGIDLCIDHHFSNTGYAAARCWNPDAAAACEMLYALVQDCDFPLSEQIALLLYAGMATDTGCFKFSNAGADTFAAVADIKRQYPNLPYARWNRIFFDLKSPGRIALDCRLMEGMQLSETGRTALVYLPYVWYAELQVSADETDGVTALPMQIAGVEVGIVVKEQEDGSFRISMRAGDMADVSAICKQFGGGGHIKASGCSMRDCTAEEACAALMQAAEAALDS